MCGISTIVTLDARPQAAAMAPERTNRNTKTTIGNGVATEMGGTHNMYEAELEKEVNASLDRITHRGPDTRGTVLSGI
jgi:hypothetical protein